MKLKLKQSQDRTINFPVRQDTPILPRFLTAVRILFRNIFMNLILLLQFQFYSRYWRFKKILSLSVDIIILTFWYMYVRCIKFNTNRCVCYIQNKIFVCKCKLTLQCSIVEHGTFLLVKMTCGAVCWGCLRWHIQNLKWNKNIPHSYVEEMEINCDGVVVQSPVTFHFQYNVLRTYETNVKENSLEKHNFLYAWCMTNSIRTAIVILYSRCTVTIRFTATCTYCCNF